MKLKLDENIPIELLDDLKRMGHEAHSVWDERLSGQPDRVILDHSRTGRTSAHHS
jgi:predicted nuclease of predicted toxin-antitoxin system